MASNTCFTLNDPEINGDAEDITKDPAKDPIEDPPELSKAVRIDLAYQAWKDANKHDPRKKQLSIKKAARIFGVSYTTLYDRIHGAIPKALANQAMQRLTIAEEEAIRDWLLDLAGWGWPLRVERLRAMAIELLADKGDMKDLGIHWTEQFLHRFPQLKTKFVAGLDKERAEAQDPDIFRHWFELYKTTVQKYSIKLRNRYNMDEKGIMMGFIGKVKVIISKHDKKIYMTQPGNREWASLIECISLDGRKTNPWMIFKAKQHQRAWFSALPGVYIALSDSGWTDNDIGFKWIKQCFEPETRPDDNSEYRLLILDGHASHITTKAIRFCIPCTVNMGLKCVARAQPIGGRRLRAVSVSARNAKRVIIRFSVNRMNFIYQIRHHYGKK